MQGILKMIVWWCSYRHEYWIWGDSMDVYLFSCIYTILLLTQRNILLQKTTTSTIIHIITIHSALSMSILHDTYNTPDSIQHLRST